MHFSGREAAHHVSAHAANWPLHNGNLDGVVDYPSSLIVELNRHFVEDDASDAFERNSA
jgi:hypothetical protein